MKMPTKPQQLLSSTAKDSQYYLTIPMGLNSKSSGFYPKSHFKLIDAVLSK
jgi:hypothetical protein